MSNMAVDLLNCRIGERRFDGRGNCGAQIEGVLTYLISKDLRFDLRDASLHPPVVGLPAELPVPSGDNERARRIG